MSRTSRRLEELEREVRALKMESYAYDLYEEKKRSVLRWVGWALYVTGVVALWWLLLYSLMHGLTEGSWE